MVDQKWMETCINAGELLYGEFPMEVFHKLYETKCPKTTTEEVMEYYDESLMMLCDGQMFTPLIATAEPLLSVFKEADEAGNPYASLHFDLDELQYLRHEREKAVDVEYWIPKAKQIEEIVTNGYISSPAMKKLEEQINRSGGDAEFLKGLWSQVSTEKLDQFESINAVMHGIFPGAQGHEDGEEFPEEKLKKIPTMDDLNAMIAQRNAQLPSEAMTASSGRSNRCYRK